MVPFELEILEHLTIICVALCKFELLEVIQVEVQISVISLLVETSSELKYHMYTSVRFCTLMLMLICFLSFNTLTLILLQLGSSWFRVFPGLLSERSNDLAVKCSIVLSRRWYTSFSWSV